MRLCLRNPTPCDYCCHRCRPGGKPRLICDSLIPRLCREAWRPVGKGLLKTLSWVWINPVLAPDSMRSQFGRGAESRPSSSGMFSNNKQCRGKTYSPVPSNDKVAVLDSHLDAKVWEGHLASETCELGFNGCDLHLWS